MHLLFINIVKLLLSEDRNNQNLYQLLKSLKTCLDMQNSGSIRGLFFIHFFANLAFPAHWDFLPKFLSLHYYTTLEIFLYPEKPKRSRNYNQFVWSDVFQPKWNDIQKTFKNYQNPVKSQILLCRIFLHCCVDCYRFYRQKLCLFFYRH